MLQDGTLPTLRMVERGRGREGEGETGKVVGAAAV